VSICISRSPVLYLGMTQFDIIGELADYAAANSMQFISGANFYQNYEATLKEYGEGQLILAARFDAAPKFSPGYKIESITYTGALMLGRKFELTDTHSNLDETFYQKYNARLLELMTMLSTAIATFACDNELSITQCNYNMLLNQLDENIDFVEAVITFVQ